MKMNGEDKIVGFTGYKEKTLLNEKYIIIMENAYSYINSTCKIFDTDTMQFAKVFDTRYFDGGSVQVFSEGLFLRDEIEMLTVLLRLADFMISMVIWL